MHGHWLKGYLRDGKEIEGGGGGSGGSGALLINWTESNQIVTADKTWGQIYDALSAGVPVLSDLSFGTPDEGFAYLVPVIACGQDPDGWLFTYVDPLGGTSPTDAVNDASRNDYPSFSKK